MRWVAARNRTSTAAVLLPPPRAHSRSCSTRSSFAWIGGVTSETSSRNSVPPSAISKRPVRVRTAPVKAPRSWPKSSDSITPSESAAQLSLTNARSLRGLLKWMALATNSLPVPVSPVISTVARELAICRILAKISVIGAELPIRFSKPNFLSSRVSRRSTRRCRRR